jgi:hypothetical protein
MLVDRLQFYFTKIIIAGFAALLTQNAKGKASSVPALPFPFHDMFNDVYLYIFYAQIYVMA